MEPAIEGDALTATRVEVSEVEFDVAVRSGSATIHANVFTDPHGSARGATVLAVPGGAATSFQFGPLAREIVAHSRLLGVAVKRVVAIDFPGHGDSPFPINLPDGTQFGDLLIEDNASVVLQSIDALRAMDLGPRMLLAHSQGGLEVQTVQQLLLANGSSLADHGVKQAILMSPVPPHGLEWHQAPFGAEPELTTDPVLGTYLTVPTTPEGAVEFQRNCFSTTAGVLVPDAPTGEEILADRYMATEPLALGAQVLELELTLPSGEAVTVFRPTIDPGVFALNHGTRLTVVSFSEDIAVPAADAKAVYEHLTGDSDDRFYRTIVSPDAVHCMLISNPDELLHALRTDSQ